MTQRQIRAIITFVFMIIGSMLIGFGTNGFIGFGVFFSIWAIAGIVDLYRK